MEESGNKSEVLTKRSLGQFGIGGWEWNIRDKIISWSPELLDIFGLTPDQHITFEFFLSRVHPDDRPRLMAKVSETLSTKRDRHEATFRILRPDGLIRTVLSRCRPQYGEDGECERLTGVDIVLDDHSDTVYQAITGLQVAEDKPRTSETLFRAVFDNAAIGILRIASNGKWLDANQAMSALTGCTRQELIDKTWQLIHRDDSDAFKVQMEVLRAGGVERVSGNYRLLHGNGSYLWAAAHLSCVRAADGEVDYYIVSIEDVSHHKLAEERNRVLLDELAHRGRNLFSVIQAVVTRTLSDDRLIAEARDTLIGRLKALSKTFDSLGKAAPGSIQLATIIQEELSSFADRADISGAEILLTPQATQTFALVVHELATNAVKYGALSVPDGRVEITWRLDGTGTDARFRFDWAEQGGPPATPPKRRGFGTMLITGVPGAEFECQPRLDYGGEGFSYGFEASLARVGSLATNTGMRSRLRHPVVISLYDVWSAQRPSNGVPQLAGFDWSRFAASGALTIARLGADGEFQMVQVGKALLERMGESFSVTEMQEEKSVLSAYRRCADEAEACHELMRIDFGDGEPFSFERLLVPFSSTPGGKVTHLAGVVVFEGATRP